MAHGPESQCIPDRQCLQAGVTIWPGPWSEVGLRKGETYHSLPFHQSFTRDLPFRTLPRMPNQTARDGEFGDEGKTRFMLSFQSM